jgi:hypothetical protein
VDPQLVFLVAMAATLVVSALIVGALWRPIHGILVDLCGTETRARFWRCYTNLMVILVPVAAVMLGRSEPRVGEAVWVSVLDEMKWAVLGLILVLFIVALGISSFIQTRAVLSIRRDQLDDLNRLVETVEEIRARQILRRTDEPGERRA